MAGDFSDIRERLARLEYAEQRSQEDRDDMKTDIKSVRADVSEIKSIVEQVKGGAKVAWAIYAMIGAVAAAVGWMASKLPIGISSR